MPLIDASTNAPAASWSAATAMLCGCPHCDEALVTSSHLILETSPHCCKRYPASVPRSETLPIRCLQWPSQCLPARSSGPIRTLDVFHSLHVSALEDIREIPRAV